MLENVQSVIFDLDGTLVDSMWLWHDIDVEFLEKRGLTLPETYQHDIEGMSFTETAVYTRELFHLEESVEELKSIWNQMAIEKYTHEVEFKPGAEAFLNHCRQQNISLGIATSNSRELVEAVASALNLWNYIQEAVTAKYKYLMENPRRMFIWKLPEGCLPTLKIVWYLKMYQWEYEQGKMLECGCVQ